MRAAKPKFQAQLLGSARFGWRSCDFPSLKRASEWCALHARRDGCSAQVVFGVNGTGKVVWRFNAREARKRPPRGK